MLLHGGITFFFLLSYLVAVKKSSRGSIACGAMILPQSQYESLVLLIAAFLELVTNLQCEQYFGRYGYYTTSSSNNRNNEDNKSSSSRTGVLVASACWCKRSAVLWSMIPLFSIHSCRRLLLLAAFLELVKILQCEQYFGRYRFESSTNNNMKYKFK